MSLVNLAHVCSHLQNASRARLGITAIQATKLHMALAHQLQKSGFINTVTLGGMTPPPVSPLLAHPPPPPLRYKTAEIEEQHADRSGAVNVMRLTPTERAPYHLLGEVEQGLTSSVEENITDAEVEAPVWELMQLPDYLEQPDRETMIPSNPAQRRLWLGLKYWNNEPVLSKMSLISKPKRRIWMNKKDIELLARGKKSGYVDGLTQIGECIYVTTSSGILEVRECLTRGIGGMMLCRVW